jgi:hypothetical protein
MGASPPALVADLVERFDRDRKVFLSPDYKEEQLRFTAGRQTRVEEKPEVRKTGELRPTRLTNVYCRLNMHVCQNKVVGP